ncbi:unnamed protein product, partial [Urochloa humidicola]
PPLLPFSIVFPPEEQAAPFPLPLLISPTQQHTHQPPSLSQCQIHQHPVLIRQRRQPRGEEVHASAVNREEKRKCLHRRPRCGRHDTNELEVEDQEPCRV